MYISSFIRQADKPQQEKIDCCLTYMLAVSQCLDNKYRKVIKQRLKYSK